MFNLESLETIHCNCFYYMILVDRFDEIICFNDDYRINRYYTTDANRTCSICLCRCCKIAQEEALYTSTKDMVEIFLNKIYEITTSIN